MGSVTGALILLINKLDIMATKWTIEKEKIIIEEIEKSPEHLRDAFFRASLKIDKTPEAICTRYYCKILKDKQQ